MHIPVIALVVFCLMLPVTGVVPVLAALTAERYPDTGDLAQHLFISMNMVGALAGAPLAGFVSDRTGKRVPLIMTGIGLAAGCLWLLTLALPYPVVLAVRFFEGAAHMAALSLLMTLAADHARREGMGATMGAIGAAVSFGVACGAPLGGWIGREDALQVPLLGAVMMLVVLVLASAVLRDTARGHTLGRSPFRALAGNRLLAVPYLFSFIDRLTVGFIVSTFSLYLSAVHGFSAARIGLVMAAFLVPFSLLTWPAGWLCRHVDRLAMLLLGSVLYGIFLLLLGIAPASGLGWLMAAGGVVAALMYAPSLVLTAQLADTSTRAMAIAGFNVAGSAGFALGPLLAGTLLGLFRNAGLEPYLPVFVVIAAIEIIAALALLPFWWRLRNDPVRKAALISD